MFGRAAITLGIGPHSSFENNLRVKQHNFHRRCSIILNKNFVWGLYGANWGTNPWPCLRTSLVGGNCARGIDALSLSKVKVNLDICKAPLSTTWCSTDGGTQFYLQTSRTCRDSSNML